MRECAHLGRPESATVVSIHDIKFRKQDGAFGGICPLGHLQDALERSPKLHQLLGDIPICIVFNTMCTFIRLCQ